MYVCVTSTFLAKTIPNTLCLRFFHVLFFLLGFYHERALLLGRVGRHEEALAIYIHILHNIKLAEE